MWGKTAHHPPWLFLCGAAAQNQLAPEVLAGDADNTGGRKSIRASVVRNYTARIFVLIHHLPLRLNGRTRTATFILSVAILTRFYYLHLLDTLLHWHSAETQSKQLGCSPLSATTAEQGKTRGSPKHHKLLHFSLVSIMARCPTRFAGADSYYRRCFY